MKNIEFDWTKAMPITGPSAPVPLKINDDGSLTPANWPFPSVLYQAGVYTVTQWAEKNLPCTCEPKANQYDESFPGHLGKCERRLMRMRTFIYVTHVWNGRDTYEATVEADSVYWKVKGVIKYQRMPVGLWKQVTGDQWKAIIPQ